MLTEHPSILLSKQATGHSNDIFREKEYAFTVKIMFVRRAVAAE